MKIILFFAQKERYCYIDGEIRTRNTNNWNTVNQAMGLEYTSLSTPKPIESDIGVILAITGDQELSFSSDVLFNVQGGMIISVDGPNISRRHSSSVISSSFTRNSYSYFHYHPNELCWEVDSWVVHCVQEYLVSFDISLR